MIDGTRGPSSDLVGLPVDSEVEDESLAATARARFRKDGMVGIEPDHQMRSALRPDEQLLAVRQAAGVELLIDGVRSMLSGPLAITNDRLLVIDGQAVTLASFDELDDVTLVTDRLLVMLTTGVGLTIDAVNPRLLRVELAAARARWSDGQLATTANGASGFDADQPRR
jgi:hypothetical protein